MKQHIYVIGDIHGGWQSIRDFVQRAPYLFRQKDAGDENVLICLGDFCGNYFGNHRDDEFKKKLSNRPLTYFVIRGNHEERASNVAAKHPDEWHKEQYFDGPVWVENKFPNIKYALDIPMIYTIDGKKTLVVPGAYSVDKMYRLMNGYSWFPQEQLNNEEMNRGLELLDYHNWQVDIVLSHTCPICFEPTDLFLSFIDQSSVDKTMERYLGQIEYTLDYKLWMWGHYHAFRDYPRTDGKKRIMLSAGQEVVELNQVFNDEEVIKL